MEDQNFQTSFIPKKPMIEARAVVSGSVSYLTIFSIFIFFTIILATGALYVYGGILTKNTAAMENDLTLSKNRFEPSKIVQLQVSDKRLRASTEILSKHITISPIFTELQSVTMKTVRYTTFNYSFDEVNNGRILIKLDGVAIGYRAVALQSDLFAKNKNFIEPMFSNLSLDDKGNVVFELSFSVDSNFVNYKNMIAGDSFDAPDTLDPLLEDDLFLDDEYMLEELN